MARIVVIDAQGRSSFQKLQRSMGKSVTNGFVFQVFDLIYLDGFDLTQTTIRTRCIAISLLVLFLSSNLTLAQNITWYGFDQTFISSHYTDSAIGDLTATQFHPAGNVVTRPSPQY